MELRTPVLEVLEEGVFQNSNSFSWLRGQIWEEVVKPKIFEELDLYWSKQARLGRTVEDILRWGYPRLSRSNILKMQETSFFEWSDETSQWKW